MFRCTHAFSVLTITTAIYDMLHILENRTQTFKCKRCIRSHYNNYKSKHVGDSKSLQQLQEQTRR